MLAEWLLAVTLDLASDGESWVVFWLLDGLDLAGTAVLGTTNLFLNNGGVGLLLGLGDSLGALMLGALRVHGGARVLHDTTGLG